MDRPGVIVAGIGRMEASCRGKRLGLGVTRVFSAVSTSRELWTLEADELVMEVAGLDFDEDNLMVIEDELGITAEELLDANSGVGVGVTRT